MEAPVSVSLGVIRSIPAKLERLLSPEDGHGLRLRKGEKNKIRRLKAHLQELIDKYLMEPSEGELPASTVRCWVKEVRELSYDIDDFLDELIHGLHADGVSKNFRGKITSLREGLSRSRWVAGETSRFMTRLEEAIQRHKRYNLDKHQIGRSVRTNWDEYPIPPLYGVEAARLVGIDRSMEKLSEWLTGDGERALTVVSIVGFGGIGKTTLATELYRKLGRQFECRAFARSSHKPDIRMLLTSILFQVRGHQVPDDLELCNLTDTIRAHLRHKKYIIIIDDLWDSSTWDIVHRAFPDDKCYSRVLTTTEFDMVAQRCCSDTSNYIFKMEPLNDKESTELFFSRFVGNQSENFEEFNQVSSKIIRKCGGFPLATIVAANILARQQDRIEFCKYINRSLSSNLRTHPTMEGMKEVLGLCYNNLSNRLKSCMLYLSVYKEGHIIWKDDLVKQWITEGFISTKEGIHMEEIARSYFDELVNVGMIQPVDISYNDEVLSCTVHCMVLNLIRYKSVEDNFITPIDYSQTNTRLADKVRRLSLHFGDVDDAEPPVNLRLSQVRSLAFFGLFKSLPSTGEFRLLRVLILHLWGDQDNLSLDLTTVCKSFRLRYLEIICNGTLNLQSKMQGLQYLETLKIDSRLSEVPPDIVNLRGLLHLSLHGDTNLPNDIGRMESLQALGCFDLSSNSIDNVLNLGELTNLQDLRLTCSKVHSDNLEKKFQCLGSILSKLRDLKSLTILRAGHSIENTLDYSAFSDNIFFDGLSCVSSPPPLLHKLDLLPPICIFSILPEWIGKLHLLGILKIQVMGLSNKDIDILDRLPVLSVLILYIRTAPAERIVFNKEIFPVLKYFKFICSALCVSFVKGAMPNVRKLKLGFNTNTMVQYSPIDAGFEHLTGLKEISANIGHAGANDSYRMAAQSALEAAFVPHRVNIHWMDWIFYGEEKERSEAAQKETHETIQNLCPIPDDITKGGSDDLLGSSPPSSLENLEGSEERSPISSSLRRPVLRSENIGAPASAARPMLPPENPSVSRSERNANFQPIPLSTASAKPKQTNFGHQLVPKIEMPSTADQWIQGKLIASGSFGCVYEATNRHTGALCAMKVFNKLPYDVQFTESIKKLEQEINFLSQFKHENIAQYCGSKIIEDTLYIYVEHVHPGSVYKYARENYGSLTESVIRSFMCHILKGLAFLHSKKIMHGDIKCSNLLVDVNGVVKLTDFGIAKPLTTGDSNLWLRRGPYWIAPEVVRAILDKNVGYDVAADIWSIGCTMIEMFTGKPPWSDLEGPAAMFKVLRTEPPIPDNLSPEGRDFLICCLKRNPAERPTASKLLEHPFIRNSFAETKSPDTSKSDARDEIDSKNELCLRGIHVNV
ncbi:hypothetical protein EJB05_25836, partial [Eragrostis curvula]